MALSGKQKRHLRALAHKLKVVVTIGSNGATDSVLGEVETALQHHELIKIKLPAVSKQERQLTLQNIQRSTGAEAIQLIGRTGVLYRPADTPLIKLPD